MHVGGNAVCTQHDLFDLRGVGQHGQHLSLIHIYDMEKVAVERAEENIRCNLEEYLEKGVVK